MIGLELELELELETPADVVWRQLRLRAAMWGRRCLVRVVQERVMAGWSAARVWRCR